MMKIDENGHNVESVIRVSEMKAGLQIVEEPPDLGELTRLSDYLNNHIDVSVNNVLYCYSLHYHMYICLSWLE